MYVVVIEEIQNMINSAQVRVVSDVCIVFCFLSPIPFLLFLFYPNTTKNRQTDTQCKSTQNHTV